MKKINLLDYKKRVYSVPGNDGIIEYIFKKLRINNGIFVEFGAWDGIKNSNCRKLLEEGWNGIFIESNISKYNNLVNNYKKYKHIYCCNNFVGFEGSAKFDNIVDPYLNGKQIDFCSIDIDGLDLEVFETFEKYLPTVVCIEGGQMLEPNHERVPKSISKNNIQQSLYVIDQSFKNKGYRLLCSYQDSFFVKEKYFNLFDVSQKIEDIYLDGLESHHRRLPWILKTIKTCGLRNKIVKEILKRSNYDKYGYDKRKEWSVKEKSLVKEIIKEMRIKCQ